MKRFRRIEAAVRAAGYDEIIDWSETISPPIDAEALARTAIFVICSSGMANAAALSIFDKCMAAFAEGRLAGEVFRHPGKAVAIDTIWENRDELFIDFLEAEDKLAFCVDLPFVGEITKYHLAKNLGADVAKPDVHLLRLAERDKVTPQQLCDRLARQTGYRAATIDTILWRACADGMLSSRVYADEGWVAAWCVRGAATRC